MGDLMSKLVDMDAFRLEHTARRAFAPWQKRFGETYSPQTGFPDLADTTVLSLAEPGEQSAAIFYELIMGVLDLGNILKFEYLKAQDRLRVVDTHLFLSDLVRYEMMHRINWIDDYQNRNRSLVELVETYDQSDYSRFTTPPQLSPDHPGFEEFESRITREKVVMLRQLFRNALERFQKQIAPP